MYRDEDAFSKLLRRVIPVTDVEESNAPVRYYDLREEFEPSNDSAVPEQKLIVTH